MLVDIDDQNRDLATKLLSTGMPRVSEARWRANVDRIAAYGGNAEAGMPYGLLLMVDGKCEGVILTLADTRQGTDATRRTIVNLSSWYITPEQRWRAPLMMRRVMRLPASVITDLTPTVSVQKMLSALGFHAINAGESIVALPYAALARSSNCNVYDLQRGTGAITGPATRTRIEKHLEYGCIGAAIETVDGITPVLFKRQSLKGMPLARLIYCPSNTKLLDNLGAVARHLLGHRQVFLKLDTPLDRPVPGLKRPASGKKFASQPISSDVTDYAGSELGLFDF